LLTTAASWEFIFWINVPIGVVALVTAPALFPGRPRATRE
jgi:MFS family permease